MGVFQMNGISVTLHELFSDASMHCAILLADPGLHELFWKKFQLNYLENPNLLK